MTNSKAETLKVWEKSLKDTWTLMSRQPGYLPRNMPRAKKIMEPTLKEDIFGDNTNQILLTQKYKILP